MSRILELWRSPKAQQLVLAFGFLLFVVSSIPLLTMVMAQPDSEMTYEVFGPVDTKKPKHLAILLHGSGSSGESMIRLAPLFADTLPNAVFVAPDAPVQFLTQNGTPVRVWYEPYRIHIRSSLDERVAEVSLVLERFIDEQMKKYKLKPKDVTLIGFSQGATMALYTGTRMEKPVHAVLAYSARMTNDDSMAQTHKIPVYVYHQQGDPLVGVEEYHAVVKAYENAGFKLQKQLINGSGHYITDEGIAAGRTFLESLNP